MEDRKEAEVRVTEGEAGNAKGRRPLVRAGAAYSHISNVRVLAGRELKRTWPSYLTSGLFNLLFGLVAVFLALTVWEGTQPGGRSDVDGSVLLSADALFIFILVNLAANWTSPRYMDTRKDRFSEYLEFLRTLPVLPGEAVAGRAAVMVAAAAVMACVFFAPLYVLAGESTWNTLGPVHYVCFASVWVAYGLFSSGALLYLELGVRGAAFRFWCLMIWTVVLLGVVLLCNLALDVHLVAGSLALTGEYGALAAIGALAVGICGFVLLALATARRAERRL